MKQPQSAVPRLRRLALEWRRRAKVPVFALCVIWLGVVGVTQRADLVALHFLGHAKGLSMIHGAEPVGPSTFLTPDGSVLDKRSYWRAHDDDTAALDEARWDLLRLLMIMAGPPAALLVLYFLLPTDAGTMRRSRQK